MYLIQLLLPLYDNEGRAFEHQSYDRVRDELAKKFGGVTAFRHSPAEGVWNEGGEVSHDRIFTYEVMSNELERAWWKHYRAELETRFRQERLVVRSTAIELL